MFLTPREFLGEEFWVWGVQDYERLCAARKGGRVMDEAGRFIAALDKRWERFWRAILF